jgi:signal transduction histidine kinase
VDLTFALTLPVWITVTVAMALLALEWTSRTLPIRGPFVFLMVAISAFTVSYLGEILSPDQGTMAAWNLLEMSVLIVLPALFLIFVVSYLGREDILDRKRLFLLSLVPFALLTMLWTNNVSHAFYADLGSKEFFGAINGLTYSYGIGFWVLVVFFVFIMVSAVTLVAQGLFSPSRYQRMQVMVVLGAAGFPMLALFIGITFSDAVPMSFIMDTGFLGTSLVLFYGSLRYELLDMTPMVLDSVIRTIEDGTLVLDTMGRIVYSNPAVEEILDLASKDINGKMLSHVSPMIEELVEAGTAKSEVPFSGAGADRIVDIHITKIVNHGEAQTGTLILLKDVTEERRNQMELKTVNSKLNLLSSITRHDILNQLVVIHGYGELIAAKRSEDEELNRIMDKIIASASAIQHGVEFTRLYQNLGVNAPEWQTLSTVLENARSAMASGSIVYHFRTSGLKVYSDLMLERMFFNLMENSQRHGGKVGNIWVDVEDRGVGKVIVYQDDGKGIGPGNKEKIFKMGFGSNTGLGLCAAREILGITGLTISENGLEGKGVRFEIEVPAGSWKMEGKTVPEGARKQTVRTAIPSDQS